VRALRRKGILEEGFSDRFAECMTTCVQGLMKKFNAVLGYTQSDEMIIFIQPTNIVKGVQQVHSRSGRVMKISTLAAGYVSAQFITLLSQFCVRHGIDSTGLLDTLPHFDCRMGQYSSWEEARGLLMWRAYDCSVNGVSDAVFQIKGSGKGIQGKGKLEKVTWLWQEGRLPLPRHQAYGSVYVKVKRIKDAFNPKTETAVQTLRGAIEHRDGPVLELMRNEELFCPDDKLPET